MAAYHRPTLHPEVPERAEAPDRAVPDQSAGSHRRDTPVGAQVPAPVTVDEGGRDRYFDVLRALAIIRVVLIHMFPVAWLSMIFPSMGVMFALGGSLMAKSVDRSAGDAITGRIRRLLPAYWVMGIVLVPAMFLTGWQHIPAVKTMVLWIVPLAEPPVTAWAAPVTGVLWYLCTYLWLVILSPVLLALYRRARVVTVVAPLLLLAAMTYVPWPFGDRADSVATDVLTFASCWILGFAHRDGDLRRVPTPVIWFVALASTSISLWWVCTHPGEEGVELSTAPIAYGAYSVGFVLILVRMSPSMGWLARRRPLVGAVNLLNSRAVTIYLWHNAAITVAFPIGDRFKLYELTGDGPLTNVAYMGIAVVLIALVVPAIGWVEDLAARRRPQLLPWGKKPQVKPRPVQKTWWGPTP